MVKIRLRRLGAKKAPFYRVVVADSRFPRDGRFIEEIGTYNPLTDPVEIKIDSERAQQWIDQSHFSYICLTLFLFHVVPPNIYFVEQG